MKVIEAMASSLPRHGKPAIELTESERFFVAVAAGVPFESSFEDGRYRMRTSRPCGIVDRGDGGYIVATGPA